MKSTLLLLILFISITHAQFIKNYGVKTGIVISHQDWDQGSFFNTKMDDVFGINTGLFAEFFNHSTRSLIVEVNYIQKGSKNNSLIAHITSPFAVEDISNWEIDLQYLNISVLAKGRYNSLVTPYVFLGPKIDFEISRTVKNDDISNYKDFAKTMYGLKSGLGIEYKLKIFKIFAEVIFDLDLNDLYDDNVLKINSKSYIFNLGVIY